MDYYFVAKDSIVRQIWGKSDTILFIFAGAAAEFSLNKAVDWLYFTGRLPADPMGRLFSTVAYARAIVFAERTAAERAIDRMTDIHGAVEAARGQAIPDWAYRDVLFMLIDYSIRAYELLERPLHAGEKAAVFEVFHRVGTRMGVHGLPATYANWLEMRQSHLRSNLVFSEHTADLFRQYRKHLGVFRYTVLLEAQKMLVPDPVRQLLQLRRGSILRLPLWLYKWGRPFGIDSYSKQILLPSAYKRQIMALDISAPNKDRTATFCKYQSHKSPTKRNVNEKRIKETID